MKKLASIILAVILFLCVFTAPVTAEEKKISDVFTDKALCANICELLGITNSDAAFADYADMIAGIKELSVSGEGITSLAGVEKCTALTLLDVSENSITSVELSENKSLKYLMINDNPISTLDLSANTSLTRIYAHDCSLSRITLPSSAVKVYLSGNELSSIDTSRCANLTELSVKNNVLTELDVSLNTALTNLWTDSNAIRSFQLCDSAEYKNVVLGNQTYTAGASMASGGKFSYSPGWKITDANTDYTYSKVTVPADNMPFELSVSGTLDGYKISADIILVNMTGDINGDGVINSKDFTVLLSKYGGDDMTCDLNCDGVINSKDFTVLLSKYAEKTY